MSYSAMSLNAAERSADSEGLTLEETIGAEDDRLELLEDGKRYAACSSGFQNGNARYFVRYFYGNRSQTVTAHELGTSHMHVSRLGSLGKLRDAALNPDAPEIAWPVRRQRRRAS